MALGPIMADLQGPVLTAEEREILQHPVIGGVILFSRNYQNSNQLTELVDDIHGLRSPRLLIGVDQEGGRVQRLRSGFTPLPALNVIGAAFDMNRREGLALAENCGWLMASELRAVGIDFSFAPVLDLRAGVSAVIGDRGFHADPDAISWLAQAYMKGMSAAGMSAVGKHYPGHGSVRADSHHETPIDDRDFADIRAKDLVPFRRLVPSGMTAVMPAHVIYPRVDALPAGFSRVWLDDILRRDLGFQGTIFSDDINMVGAAVAGDFPERAMAAIDAGCDVVLICNQREGLIGVLDTLTRASDPLAQVRLMRMHGRGALTRDGLHEDPRWQRVAAEIRALDSSPELALDGDRPA